MSGASPAVVRVAFLVATLSAGSGVAIYLVLAGLLAGRPQPPPRPTLLRYNLAIVLATAAWLLIVGSFVPAVPVGFLLAVGLVAFAAALADPSFERGLDRSTEQQTDWRSATARLGSGVVLMTAGLLTAAAGVQDVVALWQLLAAALVVLAGMAILLTPYLQRLITTAELERRDRARAEERADIAAHLHDSVLQTLTLIQNRSDDPAAATLAYQQERELRRWLYGSDDDPASAYTFRPALEAAAADVEDHYDVMVECIMVGDTELTTPATAVLSATREAMVNAAKFATTSTFSVFGEVRDETLTVFVRDRGVGFDPASVPSDRRGLTDSIVGRIDRLGGRTEIRSRPGDGTEIRIELSL